MQSANESSRSLPLFLLEESLAKKFASYNRPWTCAPQRIHARLNQLSNDIIAGIENNLATFLRCLELAEEQGVDPWSDTEFFKLSMTEMGFSYPPDFLEKIGQTDIIEAYDMHRRQIFRNMQFMEISTYSLVEVLAYEWPMLFHRDPEVTQSIIKHAEQDIWSANKTIPSTVPTHLIRELLSNSPQICEVEHRYFAPLYSGPNCPGGLLSVCRGKTVSADANVKPDNMAFL